MPGIDPSHYQYLIQIGTTMTDSTRKQWPSIPPERYPIAHFGQGLNGLCAGVGHLMLGHREEARSWFRQSADHFLHSEMLNPDTVVAEKRALECALFCKDEAFQVEIARQIPVRHTKRFPVEYPYAMFLKYSILGEQSEAATFADQAAVVNTATMKKRGGYGTLGEACQALAARQPERFTVALTALLREHKAKSTSGRNKLADGIVCFPAAALLLLAKKLERPAQVSSPYLPDSLLAEGPR